MTTWTRLWNKLRFALRRDAFRRELAEEIDFHRAMLQRDEEGLGRSHATAMLNARRRLGNSALIVEQSRDAWIVAWLDTLARDVRYALRTFARSPGFIAVVLLTLALGIGANTAIFRVVDAVMLRSLAVAHPEELAVMRGAFPYLRFQRFRDENDAFSGVLASHTMHDVEFWMGPQPLGRGAAELVTGNYFSLLGVPTVLGRPILPEDDTGPESGPVAVISYGLWQRAFGGRPDVVGRDIRLLGGRLGNSGTSGFEAPNAQRRRPDGTTLTIVGVAPPEFFGETVGALVDVWTPVTMQPALMPGRAWLTRPTAVWLKVMGRRQPGITHEQAAARAAATLRRIRVDELGPKVTDEQRRQIANLPIEVEPGARGFTELQREFSQPLAILMTVVTFVLLIACLNVANLLLARTTARRQEISMRLSLGAGRARLVRQLLTESVILAGAGGALGLALAMAGAQLLLRLVSADTQQIALRLEPDLRTLAFTAAVSILCGVTFGLVPALRATRRDLAHVLRDTPRSGSAGRSRSAKGLVAVQVSVSLILLVGAGLFLRTLHNLHTEPLGYDPEGLVLVRVDPVSAGYRDASIGRVCVELMHRLAGLPGVRSVTFSENGLFSGTESMTRIRVDGGVNPSSDDERRVNFDQVGPGYFTNVGIPLVLGRDFTEQDRAGAPGVAVVNEGLASIFFPNVNPVGHQILADDIRLDIVGVARDVKDHDVRDRPPRRMYVSYLQPIDGITTANFEVRAAGAAGGLVSALRGEIQRFDPTLPILSIRPGRELVEQRLFSERLIARLSTAFGALALLLACIGLYGVTSYGVARRTSEIGVRMALGATGRTVTTMILREIAAVVAIGAAAGTAAALALGRFVSDLIYGVNPADPVTYASAAVLLFGVALLSGCLPARRAARIDPVVALRHD
jgi:predicted permease